MAMTPPTGPPPAISPERPTAPWGAEVGDRGFEKIEPAPGILSNDAAAPLIALAGGPCRA